jgi:hypothetical protein
VNDVIFFKNDVMILSGSTANFTFIIKIHRYADNFHFSYFGGCWGMPLAGKQIYTNGSKNKNHIKCCSCNSSNCLAAKGIWIIYFCDKFAVIN